MERCSPERHAGDGKSQLDPHLQVPGLFLTHHFEGSLPGPFGSHALSGTTGPGLLRMESGGLSAHLTHCTQQWWAIQVGRKAYRSQEPRWTELARSLPHCAVWTLPSTWLHSWATPALETEASLPV